MVVDRLRPMWGKNLDCLKPDLEPEPEAESDFGVEAVACWRRSAVAAESGVRKEEENEEEGGAVVVVVVVV